MPIVGQFGSIGAANFFVPGGDFESIATVNLGASAATIDIQSIPAGFQHLQLRCVLRTDRASNAADGFTIRFNNNTASNYAWHRLSGDGASATAGAGSSASLMSTGVDVLPAATATTSIFGAAVLDILDYTSTSKAKTLRVFTGNDRNGAGIVAVTSGLWTTSNTAIDRITLAPLAGSNFIQYSTVGLYGVRA